MHPKTPKQLLQFKNIQFVWIWPTVLRRTVEMDDVMKLGKPSGLLQGFMMQFPKIAQCKQTWILKQSSAGCLGHTGHHQGHWVSLPLQHSEQQNKDCCVEFRKPPSSRDDNINAKFQISANLVTLKMMDMIYLFCCDLNNVCVFVRTQTNISRI